MLLLTRRFCHGIPFSNYFVKTCRSLYSQQLLGIDGYVANREKVKQHFLNDADKFRRSMSERQKDKTSMIFAQDLKTMIHIAGDSDLELLEDMLTKFNKQSKDMDYGNFFFGPVVMRLFHYINNADVALKLFRDPEFKNFFDQLLSCQVLLDLLYEQGRYKDVIDVFEIVRSRKVEGGLNPRHVVLLVFAACYKENTLESFKYSSELFTELNSSDRVPMRRAMLFVAGLALKQNTPHVALEIIGNVRQRNHITVQNIKVLAFTNLGRLDDALKILNSVRRVNDLTSENLFTKDVISSLKEAVIKSRDNELVHSFNHLEKSLAEKGLLSDETLTDLLTAEIQSSTFQTEYRKSNERKQSSVLKPNRRPGLEDLY